MSHPDGMIGAVTTRLDGGRCSWLALCDCGWRGAPTADKDRAQGERSAHTRTCHQDDPAALAAEYRRTVRAGRVPS